MAMPSIFPPSPIVMYIGAEGSSIGVLCPFVMLYITFDTRSYEIVHATYITINQDLYIGSRMKFYRIELRGQPSVHKNEHVLQTPCQPCSEQTRTQTLLSCFHLPCNGSCYCCNMESEAEQLATEFQFC